jgi:hypothetical protein
MPDAGQSSPSRDGQIITFYSFKGGTGRTMALANVAWILAANGKKVLIADWDLESPGLHRFFQPFINDDVSDRPGIIDFIRQYLWATNDAKIDPDALHGMEQSREAKRAEISDNIDKHLKLLDEYAIPLSWQFTGGGSLHFLSSGKQKNGGFYQATLSALNWDNFYDKLAGAQFLTALREYVKRKYDYVLIDSRTGLGDVSDICTIHLPDTVVDCFTLATQGIEGAANMAKRIQEWNKREECDVTIWPVPMRIDHSHQASVDEGIAMAVRLFEGLPAGMSDEERSTYWTEMKVPYRAPYAYQELLATIGDGPATPAGLLPSYERITAQITSGAVSALPWREEWQRRRTQLLFSRAPLSPFEVFLDFTPEDQLWAEWTAAVLASVGIRVRLATEVSAARHEPVPATRSVAIVSDFYLARMRDFPSAARPNVVISVTETRLPEELTEDMPIISLAGATQTEAVERLIEELEGRPTDLESVISGLRYPGGEGPQVQNIPARNVNFTGRDADLRALREQLRSRRLAVVLPLTIQGLGGVGKTQVALEYAHRFKAEYDIIWWMSCGQSQYVDASLADLGQRMREEFEADVPEEGGISEVVQKVLQMLNEGTTRRRWLLVYDNAEDIDELKHLLPSSRGHVLITSRNERWKDLGGESLPVDVFTRQESIRHLRRRKEEITEAEANKIADVLGDMPLAVAAAGALLADTTMTVTEYLQKLEEQPARPRPPGHPLGDYPQAVAKAWHLSLDQLKARSPAASRLLEICSAMAPDISLDLINTQAMADSLRDLDSTISERAMINRLIRQVDVLALIKLDNNVQQIQVHRVVQAVVGERMDNAEKARARRVVHRLLVEVSPQGDVDDPQTWQRYRLIWPHLRPSEAMLSTEVPVRRLLIERVRYLWQRQDLPRGRRRAEEIEEAWDGMLVRTREPEMAESLRQQLFRLRFNLANILRDLAEFQKAREIDQAVLAGQVEHLGPDHLHALQTRSSLAGDMRALGQYDDALRLDLETYQSWRDGYGEEYRGTLAAAHNLALSCLLTGDFRRALAQDLRTLDRRAVVLGPTHPRTFNSGASVARDLLEAGRYAEAVSRIETVWNQSRATLGDDDKISLTARLLLGVALRCAGHTDLAESHIEEATAGLVKGFGENSSDALAGRLSQALNWLATAEAEQRPDFFTKERFLMAKAAAESVLGVYEDRLTSLHPHSLICRLDIATASCLNEDYSAAEVGARSAFEGLKDKLGPDHPYTLSANLVLASALAYQHRLPEAAELEEQVAHGREQVLGRNHPDTLRTQANLLLTQHQQGDKGASAKRQAVLDTLGGRIGPHHPDIVMASNDGRLLSAIDPLPF